MMGEHDRAAAALTKARTLAPDNLMIIRNLDAISSTYDLYGDTELRPLEIFAVGPDNTEDSEALQKGVGQ